MFLVFFACFFARIKLKLWIAFFAFLSTSYMQSEISKSHVCSVDYFDYLISVSHSESNIANALVRCSQKKVVREQQHTSSSRLLLSELNMYFLVLIEYYI